MRLPAKTILVSLCLLSFTLGEVAGSEWPRWSWLVLTVAGVASVFVCVGDLVVALRTRRRDAARRVARVLPLDPNRRPPSNGAS